MLRGRAGSLGIRRNHMENRERKNPQDRVMEGWDGDTGEEADRTEVGSTERAMV